MFPAQGQTFVLKGARKEDYEAVQNIVDLYRSQPNLFPDYKNGKVLEYGDVKETEEDYVCFDMSNNGGVKINAFGYTGTVSYEEKDRNVLLEQLVQMFSGERTRDLGIDELYPYFEKGCKFFYLEQPDDVIVDSAAEFIKTVKEKTHLNKVLVQITSLSYVLANEILNAVDNDIDEGDFQAISRVVYGEEEVISSLTLFVVE